MDDTDSECSIAERSLREAIYREQARTTIPDRDFCRCEQAAGVGSPNPRLREGIREAVFLCVAMAAFPLRLQIRDSERQAMKLLGTHMTKAYLSLKHLWSFLDQLKFFAPDSITGHIERRGAADIRAALPQFTENLHNIIVACQKYSKAQKLEKGHRPSWRYFDEFVKALQKPFEAATGKKATAYADKNKPPEEKYHTPFVMFVEAALPLARTALDGVFHLGSRSFLLVPVQDWPRLCQTLKDGSAGTRYVGVGDRAMPAGWPLAAPITKDQRGREVEKTLRVMKQPDPSK